MLWDGLPDEWHITNPMAIADMSISDPKPALRLVEDYTAGRSGPRNMHDKLEDDGLEFDSAVPMSLPAGGSEAPERTKTLTLPRNAEASRRALYIYIYRQSAVVFSCRCEPAMRIFDESGFAVEN